MRRRWCGAPSWAQLNTPHAALYPREASDQRTAANPPPLTSPGTFSRNTFPGRLSRMILSIWSQIQRSSSWPFCLPAQLQGWQGKPAVIKSHGRPAKSSIDVWSSTPGKRAARTCRQYWSFSTNAIGWQSLTIDRPSSSPPIPEHKLTHSISSAIHLMDLLAFGGGVFGYRLAAQGAQKKGCRSPK